MAGEEEKTQHITIIMNDGKNTTIVIIPRMADFEFETVFKEPDYREVKPGFKDVNPYEAEVKSVVIMGKPLRDHLGHWMTQINSFPSS